MVNVDKLIGALTVGQELGNTKLQKEAIIELAKLFGLHVEVVTLESAARSSEIINLINGRSRIGAIKLLRELVPNTGLKEAKDMIDLIYPPNRW